MYYEKSISHFFHFKEEAHLLLLMLSVGQLAFFEMIISFQLGRTSDAIKSCTDVLGVDENDIEAYCDRGEAYLLEENYDAAIKDFQAAKNINGDFVRVSIKIYFCFYHVWYLHFLFNCHLLSCCYTSMLYLRLPFHLFTLSYQLSIFQSFSWCIINSFYHTMTSSIFWAAII